MYIHQSLLSLVPTFLAYFSAVANGAPTVMNDTNFITEPQLEKRIVGSWINSFADVGCHVPVGHYTPMVLASTSCIVWNSSQPGLYFGINWGQGDVAVNQIKLFVDTECSDMGGAPLYAGSKGEKPGNYIQQKPKGMYPHGAPYGECFDGVGRSWPVASNGQPFMSFKASRGPSH